MAIKKSAERFRDATIKAYKQGHKMRLGPMDVLIDVVNNSFLKQIKMAKEGRMED